MHDLYRFKPIYARQDGHKASAAGSEKKQAIACGHRAFSLPILISTTLAVSGCASLGGSGPSSSSINQAAGQTYDDQSITLVNLNATSLQHIKAFEKSQSFASVFGESDVKNPIVGIGDHIAITLWEASPAILFGSGQSAKISASLGEGAEGRNIVK